ncbi:MAG: O-antigen ligase family protein [Erysipelotrichaceae bacterium]
MKNKINKDQLIKLCLIFAVAILPFCFFKLANYRFVYGRAIILNILGALLLVILLVKKVKLKLRKENKLALLFLLTLVIATSVSLSYNIALFGNTLRHEGLIVLSIYVLLFIVASNYSIINKKVIMIVMVGGTIITLYAMLQLLGYDFILVDLLHYKEKATPSGFFSNQNFMGSYAVMMATLSSAMYVFHKKKSYLVMATINFGGLLATLTRGCWLSFGLICLITLIQLFKDEEKRKRIWILSICFILMFVSLNFMSNGLLLGRAQTIKDNLDITKEETASGRVELWKTVISTLDDRLLIGTGPDTLRERIEVYNPEAADKLAIEKGKYIDKAHNELLEYLVCGGLFTMIIYAVMCIMIFVKLFKMRKQEEAFILFLLGFGYFTQAMFNISTIGIAQIYWIVLGQSIYVIYRDDKKMFIESE